MTRIARAWGPAFLILAILMGFGCNEASASKGTIEIGSDTPSGVTAGLAAQYGAAFAVAQTRSVRGFTLKFVPYDDTRQGSYNGDAGAQNVEQMVARSGLLGMVGPIISAVTLAELPIANRASLAIVGPTEGNVCQDVAFDDICRHPAPDLRPTGKNNFFHIAATYMLQAAAMADFAYDTLGLRKVAVWDDQKTFGTAGANSFSAEFRTRGGTTVARQGFDTANRPDFRDWLRNVKAAGAQGIYAGASDGCATRQQSEGILDANSYYLGPGGTGFDLPFGIASCISEAGAMANDHVYASLGVGDANLNLSAAATIAAYKKVHSDPLDTNPYTFVGYDCAAILIDAIGRAIDANGGKTPSRRQVIDALGRTTSFHGLTGTHTFNANGDATTPTLQIMQYMPAAQSWTPIKNMTIAGS